MLTLSTPESIRSCNGCSSTEHVAEDDDDDDDDEVNEESSASVVAVIVIDPNLSLLHLYVR